MTADFKWMIYGQLGSFMWHRMANPKRITDPQGRYIPVQTKLEVDNFLLRLKYAREKGANAVLVDVGEAIRYPSHPEIWIDGALSAAAAKDLVARIKALGYESVIPSLNFSTDHHHWLGEYQRMDSTPDYYRVCEDLIRDAWEIFGHPSVFHLGYDEEDMGCTFAHAKDYPNLVTVRQGPLYWHDFNWFCDVCRKLGSRPSIWMDKNRRNVSYEELTANTPKDVLLTPWDYTSVYEGNTTPKVVKMIKSMKRMAQDGYDLIPIGSNWLHPSSRTPAKKTTRENIPNLYRWACANLDPEHFVGFGVAPWAGLSAAGNGEWFESVDLMRSVMPSA